MLTITLTPSGSGQQVVTLGDDSAGDVISFDQREHTRLVDEVPMFAAAAQKAVASNNAINSLGFTVEKIFADFATALAFYLTFADSLPAQGTLTITGSSTGIVLANATLRTWTSPSLDGVSVKVHYQFTGGLFS